ncbi:MAG: hypothetical protein BAJATHORv1_20138 [Candidatus Thorarchaeota archaeon]|nr:MAG: hypothetical protein BAJATHORv1_20138 [Candidatus Thorarchaeota archaeon]
MWFAYFSQYSWGQIGTELIQVRVSLIIFCYVRILKISKSHRDIRRV